MSPITITTVLDENHEAVIHLPDFPPGPVKITIEAVSEELTSDPKTRREQLIAKFNAAGIAVTNGKYAPPDAMPLSQEERERLWKKMAAGKTALELVDEEREERL